MSTVTETNKKPLLEVKGLKQYFPVSRKFTVKAVEDVSFYINPGETYGLVGESGSGKTTLLNILCGSVPIDRGEVRIEGRNVEKMQDYRLAENGISGFDGAVRKSIGNALHGFDWASLGNKRL